MNVIFDFTINKVGGFEIGEGEFFTGENVTKTDFIVFARETKRKYYLYIYPNVIYEEYIAENWTSEEWVEMSTNYVTYIYDKKELVNYFTSLLSGDIKNKSIYQPCSDDGTFTVNNFWFYYANECSHKTISTPMKNMNRTNRMISKYNISCTH